MTTKITVIYDNPLDPAAFEASYAEQLELAKQLPGLERFESAKVWPKRTARLHRRTGCSTCISRTTTPQARLPPPEAATLFPAIFGLATGGLRITFADVEG
jgi:hypothetical protein